MTVLARLAVSGFTYIPKPEKPIARPAVVADPYVSAFRNFLETTRNNSSSVVRVAVCFDNVISGKAQCQCSIL